MFSNDNGYIVKKILSANDCGLTGAHQAGILIPKDERILGYFPLLNTAEKNPRCVLHFTDDTGVVYRFCFIYYNSRLLCCGTRNEYRLTCMTEYIRSANLKAGDVLRFSKVDGEYHIGYKRKTVDDECQDDGVILVTTGKWKVVQI